MKLSELLKPQASEDASGLLAEEESELRAWLARIEETDPTIIDACLNQCRNDPEARDYFLRHARQNAPERDTAALVTCGGCQYFKRVDHPAMGQCGKSGRVNLLWDSDPRQCFDYLGK